MSARVVSDIISITRIFLSAWHPTTLQARLTLIFYQLFQLISSSTLVFDTEAKKIRNIHCQNFNDSNDFVTFDFTFKDLHAEKYSHCAHNDMPIRIVQENGVRRRSPTKYAKTSLGCLCSVLDGEFDDQCKCDLGIFAKLAELKGGGVGHQPAIR